MRISQLSAASGVSLPTLKFYLREGLLQPGASTGRNQADYDERHLRRLRLVRALTEVGNLSLKEVKAVLDAAADPGLTVHELLGVAQYALEPATPPTIDASAAATVDSAIELLGWRVSEDAPARRSIAHAVDVLRSLGWSVEPADLVRYAKAVDRLAESEVAISDGATDRERLVERMVVGSVVFEAILTAFRRLAQEHHSAVRRRSVTER
jgi:DNA-binding transcriptional MerR regulator